MTQNETRNETQNDAERPDDQNALRTPPGQGRNVERAVGCLRIGPGEPAELEFFERVLEQGVK